VRIPDLKKKSEKQIETILRNGVKNLGGRAYKFTSPAHRSVPDRLILLPERRIYFTEVKTLDGELTALQAKEIDFLRGLGFSADALYGEDEVRQFLKELEHGSI